MKTSDIIGMGLMLFAFFLGAGNLIFPAWAGYQAGSNLWWSYLGYVLTDVGLSLFAIVAIARAGSPDALTEALPAGLGTLFWVIVYIVIGPAFAIPRTGVVAYDVGVAPWLGSHSPVYQGIHSVIFFAIVLWLCLFPGRLVTVIGKVLLPVLAVTLMSIYLAMIVEPSAAHFTPATGGNWASQPVSEGVLQGYLTMDTFGAMAFGIAIITALKTYGIEDRKRLVRYTLVSSMIAGVGLCAVYAGLFYLGALGRFHLDHAAGGGQILTVMVYQLLGNWGQAALSIIIILACLTTAVGVGTSCGEYFAQRWPKIPYRLWVSSICALSAIVANVGLQTLITLSVPIVITLYPLAIVMVFAQLMPRGFWQISPGLLRLTLSVVLCFSVLDGIKSSGVVGDLHNLNWIPLFDSSLAWLLPAMVCIVCGWTYQSVRRRSLVIGKGVS
ncbi:Branched-chain amino acid transport system 2 carrier protein [BD1-7 clade bacterium]|nr:Branched-chain amino acid transport system 2 carrier protein [BD1-7 clade bacterium]